MKELQKYDGIQKVRVTPYERKAQYYETDQMGIIHHSNYIRWMEEARMDLLEQIGFSYLEMENLEVISPVLSVNCEYKSMVHFNDIVLIDAKIAAYDGIRMEIEYRITDKEDGELRAVGKTEHCFLNRSGQPISLKRTYPELSTRFFEMSDDE
jgi:acyl-CoA thioester hydrolase